MTSEKNRLLAELEDIINQIEDLQHLQRKIVTQLRNIDRAVTVDLAVKDEEDGDNQVCRRQETREERLIRRDLIMNSREDFVIVPRLGDVVLIINPKKGQSRTGVVEGFCSDGKLKIVTNNGKKITRLPKNVRVTNDPSTL